MANTRRRMAALLAALVLAGCSWVPDAVNPVAWYRDLSGASKNDALDKGAANQKNLEAGGKEPYPNLATVPDEPSNATSQIDRDALQKSLVADRTNAQYSAEELHAGLSATVSVPPPPAPAPAGAAAPTAPAPAAAAAPAAPAPSAAAAPAAPAAAQQQAEATSPAESSLKSPTIPSVPKGEPPLPPPPPPDVGETPAPISAPTTPVRVASLPAGRRRAATQSEPVGSIAWDGATALSDEELKRLASIAALQHAKGGALRIVGHAAEEAGEDAQQKMQSFTLALTRAKTVAQALGSEGVPPQQIAIDAVPNAPGDSAAGTTEIFLEH